MSNQYEVLGKAPRAEELKKLSTNDNHVTIKKLSAGYGKMEILHDFDLFVSKAQSLCLIGPNGAGKSTILHSIYGFTNIFSGQIEIEGKEKKKITDQELNDRNLNPACVQSCPTGTLTFGDYLDPDSKVSELSKDKRAYTLLEGLGTEPNVVYLKKVESGNGHQEHGDEGNAHE